MAYLPNAKKAAAPAITNAALRFVNDTTPAKIRKHSGKPNFMITSLAITPKVVASVY